MDQNPETSQFDPGEEPAPEPTPPPEPWVIETSFETPQPPVAEPVVIDTAFTESTPSAAQATPVQPAAPRNQAQYVEAPRKKDNTAWIVVLIILLVVLCCCCMLLGGILWLTGNLFVPIFQGLYDVIISILNSIFGGVIQFY